MSKQINDIAQLIPDPQNARKHNPRNVGLIEEALGAIGTARSIVVDEDGTILAGNATVEAAAAAGIRRVLVVDSDGETLVAVRRTGLTAGQKKRLAYYDNRTAELAGWDREQVSADMAEGFELSSVGFSQEEIDALLDALPDESPELDEGIAADLALKARWTLTFPLDQVPAIRLALAQLQEDVPGLGWKEDTTV